MQNYESKVAIITPVYNGEGDIVNCFNSVSSQTYQNIEWVIIDDGSTDGTVDVINKIIANNGNKNLSIKLIKQSNRGAANARENGIAYTDSHYISILDCDDFLSPDAIGLAMNTIKENTNIEFVCYDVANVINGKSTSKFIFSVPQWPISGKKAFGLCIDGWGIHGWALIKRELVLKAYKDKKSLSLYDSYDNNINDDELITRLAVYNANLVGHCKGVYSYVENPNSTTNRINKNYHRICLNEMKLSNFINTNVSSLNELSNKHLLASFWGVFFRFLKWGIKLDNKKEWITSLSLIEKSISLRLEFKNLHFDLSLLKSLMKIMAVILIRILK